jgi:methylated-DNA-[protein]-cysteine S-methyltransferase
MSNESNAKTIYTCRIDTPLGKMTASSAGGALSGLWFVGQRHFPDQNSEWKENPGDILFIRLKDWLADYFRGIVKRPEFRLETGGTPFQQRIWHCLIEIPYGQVRTYAEIAQKAASDRGTVHSAARAAGGAIGRNPISIIIPCHRVIGSDGSLTGYAGGIDKKVALLRLEGVEVQALPSQVSRRR